MDPDKLKQVEFDDDAFLGGYYLPRFSFGPRLAHYYGDSVRSMFLIIAAGMLFLAPFFGSRLPFDVPFEVLGAIAIVCLGAMTSPRRPYVMMANATAAGIGVVYSEIIAIYAYSGGDSLTFVIRELFAVGFLFALYFSVKTLRAMLSGRIGKRPLPGDFYESITRRTHGMTDSGD